MTLEIHQIDDPHARSCFLRQPNGAIGLLLNADDCRLLALDIREVLRFASTATRRPMSTAESVGFRKLEDLMQSIDTVRQSKP